MSRIDVLSVASEIFPLIKTGGLADVAGALPGALKPEGVVVRPLIPGYPAVTRAMRRAGVAHVFEDLYGGPARLLAGRVGRLELFALDAPHLYGRPGGPYAGVDGRDFGDNALRFAALARVGASLGQGLLGNYRPEIVHAHDWQAGLVAAFLTFDGGPRPGVVMTVHNLAFQGQFDRRLLARLGLPPQSFGPDGVEYYGDIGFLKSGLRLADRITTVSPTYAAEICTPEGGMGLDGLLRGRADRLSGILNGIAQLTGQELAINRLAAALDAKDRNALTSHFSGASYQDLVFALRGVRNVWTGDFGGETRPGLGGLIARVDPALAQKILHALDHAEESVSMLETPLDRETLAAAPNSSARQTAEGAIANLKSLASLIRDAGAKLGVMVILPN